MSQGRKHDLSDQKAQNEAPVELREKLDEEAVSALLEHTPDEPKPDKAQKVDSFEIYDVDSLTSEEPTANYEDFNTSSPDLQQDASSSASVCSDAADAPVSRPVDTSASEAAGKTVSTRTDRPLTADSSESSASSENRLSEESEAEVGAAQANEHTDEANVEGDERYKPESVDEYLEDDEHLLASSDEILHQDEETVIVKQQEAVVKWDIQGLYDEHGKVRAKRSLKNNPPMLEISNSFGENATFVLTKDLSGVLARHFDNTYRAYYGIRPKDEMSFKDKLSETKAGIRENMGKTIVIGGLLLALLIFGFFF